MALFDHIALRTTLGNAPFKYLGVYDGEIKLKGFLTYSTDAVLTTNAKFALTNGPDGLVHVRSCHNNRYWARSSTDENWIIAQETTPVTNKSAWNCTLFRMDVDEENRATFFHVQSQRTVSLQALNKISKDRFLSVDPAASTTAISALIDYDELVVLPSLVVFKGDNGLFYSNNGTFPSYGQFVSNDIGDSNIVWSISNTNDGHTRIQFYSDAPNNWQRHSDPHLSSDFISQVNKEEDRDDQLFSVVKVDDNVVALRNVGNNMFCARGVAEFRTVIGVFTIQDVLTVATNSIRKEARLQVMEPVLNRRVEVLGFNRDNARIYNLIPLSTLQVVFENPTNEEQTGQLDLRMTTTKTSTWTNSVNVTVGVKTTFETGIPFIAEGKIEVSVQASYGYQWQQSIQETLELGSVYTVKVPPKTKAVGQAVATSGSCDVPFFYYQIDKLTNGTTKAQRLFDGVFTGVSAFDFDHKVQYFPLQTSALAPTF